MLMAIGADELRKALTDIEAAERNGFMHCLAVLETKGVFHCGNLELRYSDLWERAHVTDPSKDWGRFQGVSRWNKWDGKRLVKLEDSDAVSKR